MTGQDGERYLIKRNYGPSCQQSLNEVFAAEIHKRQNQLSYTPYELTKLSTEQGDNYGCICPDFVMSNIDRHFNNFGVLRDSETLGFVGMASIYDSGNSMFWNRPRIAPDFNFLD